MALRHGGHILVDQLKVNGVERVFSVPGESFLAALDGLYNSGIENIVCRHEGGAAMMAEADAKITHSPGVVFVTRGPGATNASSGIHVAMQDSTPLIVFVGQVPLEHRDREAFQEIDYERFFSPIAKWVAEVKDLKRLPEYVARAFQVSQAGRPGPVIISLPEDILSGICEVPDRPRVVLGQQFTSDSEIKKIENAIIKAKRPLVIVGGTGWGKGVVKNLGVFVKNFNLPVATTFRRQHLIDNRHDCYIGDLGTGMNPALAETVKGSDLIIAIGTRLGEIATGAYELIDPKKTEQEIIHIHTDPNEFCHVYQPRLAVLSSTENILDQLVGLSKLVNPEWSSQTSEGRQNYLNWITPKETPGPVKLEKIIKWLSNNLPEDSIVTNGAGNYAAFLHRYFAFKEYPTAIGPTSGSMGYGFPASIAAKLRFPDKTVICLAGDGCFQMTLNEMSTAAQNKLAIIVIVVNNGKYATIRMHQEKNYPGRVSGTELHNPDFAALAKAYGGFGIKVQKTEDFVAAYNEAVASGLLSVIELQIDDEVLSTSQTVSEVRYNNSK
ncbi:MAG: thiamine pyrophosphate-binding protein [Rhodobacteraceae bacterium]|jgi:acetolactate synthase-1/2/3 large subunit|nr:thiamine pyrophosphate-binding protein [Paracoccaceae bacterium]MDC0329204.1 thiamine pyrophosphate-binding protein [bacterium]MDG1299315.1 thiamine pyrophosphate-binding protein [Paracoccaceae bacterium]MDG2373926.1 thiamine pyrophosphate-binding protein [Paracoccaceae bacterium]|tara:strand:+ start:12366 stop:14024 length:1659 start_codon:yes stop_codon:yes gene_type:complete